MPFKMRLGNAMSSASVSFRLKRTSIINKFSAIGSGMISNNSNNLSIREKSILIGLYLSKFDVDGIATLGFASFSEAYNSFALAIGTKPATIKNYRDELDPYFPNSRKGWHQRPLRKHCEQVFEKYKSTDVDVFKKIIYNLVSLPVFGDETCREGHSEISGGTFAKRLITGKAAENFFIKHHGKEEEFRCSQLTDVTQTGCGYDFKLHDASIDQVYAVEVKGLRTEHGHIAMTEKEYLVAGNLTENYFLYVVKNFEDFPVAINIRNPLKSSLAFTKRQRVVTQITWSSAI